MNNIKIMALAILVALSLNGCISRFFSVGEENTYCDEHGCNYTDVGVCGSPFDILENKDDLSGLKKLNKEKDNNK